MEVTTLKPNVPSQKILVIDDEKEMRNIVAFLLKESGYEVIEADNGINGLAAVKTSIPDLILCDVNMPMMDGSALLDELKGISEFAEIPFIFLTGNSAHADMRKGMQLGADDYLTKPFSPKELLEAVETRLLKKLSLKKYYDIQFTDIKTSILSSLPHEFRTPLSSILGFSEILQTSSALPPHEAQEIGTLINSAAKRLHHLLENMILFSHLEIWVHDQEKTRMLRKESATLAEVCASVSISLMSIHDRAGAIQSSIVNCKVQISSVYLTKIMRELIDNALKFSKPGTKIILSNEVKGNDVFIAIQDDGRGMSQQQIDTISAFRQFDRHYYEQQGAGLGLAIAKTLVEIHGGSLTIESVEKIGTTVTLRLPKT